MTQLAGSQPEFRGVDERTGCGVGSDVVAIVSDRTRDLGRSQRDLLERVIAASGHDRHDVMEVRVSECAIEIDVIDFELPEWPLHTLRFSPSGWSPRPFCTEVPARTG